MDAAGLENLIKPLLLKDLRIQCRQRGISPAGSRDELAARLKEHMLQTNDFNLRNEDGSVMNNITVTQLFGQASASTGNNYVRTNGQNVGNFLGDRPSSRVLAAPGGNSSFSLGHGAASQYQQASAAIEPTTPPRPPPINTQVPATPPTEKMSFLDSMAAQIANKSHHKYAPTPSQAPAAPVADRPSAAVPTPVTAPENLPPKMFNTSGGHNNNYHRPGGQNVGNFLTDKPSSRVLAPPGGTSSITFG